MSKKYVGNGKWVTVPKKNPPKKKVTPTKKPSVKPKPTSSGAKKISGNNEKKPPTKVTVPKLGKTSKASTDSKVSKDAEKKYNEKIDHILSGDVSLRVARPKLKAKQTITLEGFGNAISGLFFVETVKHSFDSNGYTQSLTVSKSGFGENIQKVKGAKKPVANKGKGGKTSSSSTKPSTEGKSHVIKKGDTLSAISLRYYKTANRWREIAKANNISDREVKRLKIGRKITIP